MPTNFKIEPKRFTLTRNIGSPPIPKKKKETRFSKCVSILLRIKTSPSSKERRVELIPSFFLFTHFLFYSLPYTFFISLRIDFKNSNIPKKKFILFTPFSRCLNSRGILCSKFIYHTPVWRLYSKRPSRGSFSGFTIEKFFGATFLRFLLFNFHSCWNTIQVGLVSVLFPL